MSLDELIFEEIFDFKSSLFVRRLIESMEEISFLSSKFILLFFYHFVILGIVINEEQPLKILSIVTYFNVHFDISGKYDNEEQLQNIEFMFLTLSTDQFEISGINSKEEQSKNI